MVGLKRKVRVGRRKSKTLQPCNLAKYMSINKKLKSYVTKRNQKSQPAKHPHLEWGWRAAFYLLTRTYYHKYHLCTIRDIITRWAPPNENNTQAYIENVSRLTGIDPDDPLGSPSDTPARWMMVGTAMAIQENGTTSLDYFAMLRGWEMSR